MVYKLELAYRSFAALPTSDQTEMKELMTEETGIGTGIGTGTETETGSPGSWIETVMADMQFGEVEATTTGQVVDGAGAIRVTAGHPPTEEGEGARTSTIRLGTTREAGSGETTGLLHATTAELRAESGENGEPGGRVQVEADLPKGNVAGQVQDQCERLEMRIREELIAAGVGPTGRVSLKAQRVHTSQQPSHTEWGEHGVVLMAATDRMSCLAVHFATASLMYLLTAL